MSAYCRAEPARTGAVLLAPALATLAGAASAREFRAADTQNENYPTVHLQRSLYAAAMRDPASAALIERIRGVE